MATYTNVKDYGATGNGVTDDTAAFNAMLAAERQVIVPPGTYLINGRVGSLSDTRRVTFKGAGPGNTTLLLGANGGIDVSGFAWTVDGFTFRPNDIVTAALRTGQTDNNEGSSLRNCHFLSESPTSDPQQRYFVTAVDAYSWWYGTIDNCLFRNGPAYDSYRGTGLKFHYSVNMMFNNCSVACFNDGYVWTADKSQGTTGNVCEGHVISNSIFIVNKRNLVFDDGLLPTIVNNIIDLAKNDGSCIVSQAYCTIITGNWIAMQDGLGQNQPLVYLSRGDSHIVSNNVITANANGGIGVVFANGSYGVVSGNAFRGLRQALTSNGNASQWLVFGNQFTSQGGVAGNLSLVSNLQYYGNVVAGPAMILPPGMPTFKSHFATSVVVQSGSSNAEQTFSVSFPAGRFASAPIAVAVMGYNPFAGGAPRYTVYVNDNITTSGCQVVVKQTDGGVIGSGTLFRLNIIAQDNG